VEDDTRRARTVPLARSASVGRPFAIVILAFVSNSLTIRCSKPRAITGTAEIWRLINDFLVAGAYRWVPIDHSSDSVKRKLL
jgi:hypothetical protein